MSKPRVLIADDDSNLLAALRVRLVNSGFDVSTAGDGYRALVEARQGQPDVLVLDINMPAGSGFSVQERLEKMPISIQGWMKAIPVIYITGEKSERVLSLSQELGAFSVLYKPFQAEDLCDLIFQAVSSSPSAA